LTKGGNEEDVEMKEEDNNNMQNVDELICEEEAPLRMAKREKQ
jgi:hypothetical protein